MHLLTGSAAAAALLLARTRYTRALDVFKPSILLAANPSRSVPSDAPRVFIQSANNFGRNGLTFPLSKCSLRKGRTDEEVILEVDGEPGLWHVGLNACAINGQKTTLHTAHEALEKAWGAGKIIGELRKAPLPNRQWKVGPVAPHIKLKKN